MLWKCCTQYASKFGKLSNGHRTGKGQFSFQSQRKAMPKNAQTTTQLHSSHMASKEMLKILQARLQQYVNCKLPDVQVGFRKCKGTTDQIANIHWIIEKVREFQKNIYFCFIDYTKALTVWITTNYGKFLRDGNTRSPYLPPEKSVCTSRSNRNEHGTTDWFQIRKGIHQGCILSPCLFNLYAEYIMRNARLDEAQIGIKIARRNINNLGYADDTTLMAESEELKSLLRWDLKMRVKKLA